MIKKILEIIKNDMKEVRSNKRELQLAAKERLRQLENERVEALNELESSSDPWFDDYWRNNLNMRYDDLKQDVLDDLLAQWHNDQVYYLIYKDGSDCVISAEDILLGVKFPKITDVVYAELQSADDHFDTETGELDWYSDERLEASDYDISMEEERKMQYEAAIQYKYNTEWSKRFRKRFPDFVPIKIKSSRYSR